MAAPVNGTAAAGSIALEANTDLTAATSGEQQLAVIAAYLATAENQYNQANPTEAPRTRITIDPNFDNSVVVITAELLLQNNAAMVRLTDAVKPHIPLV